MSRRPSIRIGHAFISMIVVTLIAMVGYSARVTVAFRASTTQLGIASHEQSLVERYVQDLLVRARGGKADPTGTLEELQATNEALLHGGPVTALEGSVDTAVVIGGTRDPDLVAKLRGARGILTTLATDGDRFLDATGPHGIMTDDAAPILQELRISAAELSSTTRDIAGTILASQQQAIQRLLVMEITIGCIGLAGALGISAIVRRIGTVRVAARYEALVAHSHDVIGILGRDTAFLYASPSIAELLGHPAADVVGVPFTEFIPVDEHERILAEFQALRSVPEASVTVQARLVHADGRILTAEIHAQNRSDDRAVGGIVLNVRDITAQRRLVDQLAHKAFHDDLTGLANRALLTDRLEHAIHRTRRSGGVVSVVYVDLDHFKMINDTLGHNTGDDVLVEVARRIEHAVRDGDTVARLGGDEFAVVCEDATPGIAESICLRILAALRVGFVTNGHDVSLRASLGLADNATDALDAEELLQRADAAMYAAKSHGRDRHERFAESMFADLIVRHELHSDLRGALLREELVVHYQPLVDLDTNRIESVEALARWMHPTRGLVNPADFVPLAEETGLIVPIGNHVLRTACAQLAQWRAEGSTDLAIGVNVAAPQLVEEDFVDTVRDAIHDAGVPADQIVLELTESVLMANIELAVTRLDALRALGVRLAIDDFGTGYSSLAYLRDLPVDTIKIDRSFVAELSKGSPQGSELVDVMISLGRTLRLNVIAEGIEDAEQLDRLRELGCHVGQGYLFSRPLPAGELGPLLAAQHTPV